MGILSERLYNEFEDFKREVLKMSTKDTVNKAYELVAKENIPYIFEDIEEEIDDKTRERLNSMGNLLDFLYYEWIRSDFSMASEMTWCFENLIDDLSREKSGDIKIAQGWGNSPTPANYKTRRNKNDTLRKIKH